ncbi:DUF6712 family protein [Spirosoma oryzicola]|uniref:DUF6712 family protein n=1 Tax=Spirosoma oryzicola TaxID=2898794 RepID=UPI001E601D10|nr:DUF6712 family protein [Spirosoma oryzicola]UHG93397.1 hypothetical protein LQ777_10940 [Spirosoma oryzicola]
MLTEDILKEQLGSLQANMSLETINPFARHAERWFRAEVGVDLFTFLKSDQASQATYKELLWLAQSCMAWQCFVLAFPHQKFRISDLGMMKSTPNTTIAVTKWEYVDSRDANLSMLDWSLEYFWRELEAVRPDTWVDSEGYRTRNQHFVRSADELGQLVPMAGRNYRFFQKLLVHIEEIEDELIATTLTPQLYQVLKQKWRTPRSTWSFQEEQLISLVRKAVAYLAIDKAWPYLPLSFSEIGLAERRQKDGTGGEEVAADKDQRNNLRLTIARDAQTRLDRITSYLDQVSTPLLFPSYYQRLQTSSTTVVADDFTNTAHVIL